MKKVSPYDKLKTAFDKGTGVNLTPHDVEVLMQDTAIRDACFETYKSEWTPEEDKT